MTVGAPMMANEVSVWAQLSEVSNLRGELGRIAAGLTPARHIQPAYHGLAHTLKSPATPTKEKGSSLLLTLSSVPAICSSHG